MHLHRRGERRRSTSTNSWLQTAWWSPLLIISFEHGADYICYGLSRFITTFDSAAALGRHNEVAARFIGLFSRGVFFRWGLFWDGSAQMELFGTKQRMGAVSSQSTLYNEKRSCMVVDQHLHIGVLSGSFASSRHRLRISRFPASDARKGRAHYTPS